VCAASVPDKAEDLAEAARNFQVFVSILREWEEAERLKALAVNAETEVAPVVKRVEDS
jgi:hypothetical protein